MTKTRVALIGCGMISKTYLTNLKSYDAVELVGCSDIVEERAAQRAEQFGIRKMTNEEILRDTTIEWVVNTTYPLSHYEVARAALEAGKNVYTEKMVCETVAQMDELMALAAERNLFFGGAPDTFLGGGAQLARVLLDSGLLGKPTMVSAFLSRSYHHERFYQGDYKRFAFCRHGGIIFDMGAYYLSELVFLLGGIAAVTGFSEIRDPDRTYSHPNCPLYGTPMTVETPNNVTGSLLFANGVMGQITMTSEGGCTSNRFVIHCTDGMIDLGDPNEYGESVRIVNKAGVESVIATPFAYTKGNNRGLGVLDAIYARRLGRAPRTDGALCRHVLEAALGICQSAEDGMTYRMKTTATRPQPLLPGYTEYPELVFAQK
jgi:predicted dehydrogenase